MAKRNDYRLIEDLSGIFATYCDEHGLSFTEGTDLAERIGLELESVADDRESDA